MESSALSTSETLTPQQASPSRKGLRILVAQNVPHNGRGGMSRMLGFMHDRVVRDGHTVDFFTADDIAPHLNRRLGRFVFPWKLWRHAVAAARSGHPYDIVNVHEPSGAVLCYGRKAAGNPLVMITSHGLEERGWKLRLEDAKLGRNPVRFRTRVWHPLTQLIPATIGLRNADYICCLNDEDRSHILKRYRHREDRITRLFPAASDAYLAAYSRRTYSHVDRILVFGTWIPRKGIIEIVQAFAALAARRPDLKLLMIGTGFPQEHVLKSFPEKLHSRIEFSPPGTEEELADHILKASVYWLPSKFEGTPQTLMETMATGLPAIASATCGMKDVIHDGVNGILIPIRNAEALATATDRILNNSGLRERLGRQAHADVAANYTWDRVAEQLSAVYNSIAKLRINRLGAR